MRGNRQRYGQRVKIVVCAPEWPWPVEPFLALRALISRARQQWFRLSDDRNRRRAQVVHVDWWLEGVGGQGRLRISVDHTVHVVS